MGRAYDFTETEILKIKNEFGFVCAACGCDDEEHIEADHWYPKNKKYGVALCRFCNGSKGSAILPIKPLLPRKAPGNNDKSMYKAMIKENRKVWVEYCNRYKSNKKDLRKLKFEAPF